MKPHAVLERAREIVRYLTASIDTPYDGSSSMTTTIYDTAWLAMVARTDGPKAVDLCTEHSRGQWAFPQSFQALLDGQRIDGGFGDYDQGAQVDAILSTMAAILALCMHARNPSVTGCPPVTDLAKRIARGKSFLANALSDWDVLSTDRVGFEILVPKLLYLLRVWAQIDLRDVFGGYDTLMEMKRRKLAMFTPALLYSTHQTTLVHSLEAFIGDLDFDKVSHHLSCGAMMNSPASTAAYLMSCSTWDDRAEAYLHYVAEHGNGLVPSAFPITLFEISWTLSTLLEAGFTIQELGEEAVMKLAGFVEAQLMGNQGVCGFAPNILPDADDTAKCIFLLCLVGRTTDCEKMITEFETQTHFRTYNHEVTHSFSANCNVLKALLNSNKAVQYLPQIRKALEYLSKNWEKGQLKDKWNLSPQYSIMLLTETLLTALRLWDTGILSDDSTEDLITARVPIMSLQMLMRTLSMQRKDGSWASSVEVTAYGVLTLKRMKSLPWNKDLQILIDRAISDGVNFLETNENNWDIPDLIWVEKTTYGSKILSQTYCLASVTASTSSYWGRHVMQLFSSSGLGDNSYEAYYFTRAPQLCRNMSTEALS